MHASPSDSDSHHRLDLPEELETVRHTRQPKCDGDRTHHGCDKCDLADQDVVLVVAVGLQQRPIDVLGKSTAEETTRQSQELMTAARIEATNCPIRPGAIVGRRSRASTPYMWSESMPAPRRDRYRPDRSLLNIPAPRSQWSGFATAPQEGDRIPYSYQA